MRTGGGVIVPRHALRPSHTVPFTPPVYGVYGPGIGGDSLANTQVGGPSSGTRKSYCRFRASVSSTLVTVTFYYQMGGGYGAGTGGTGTVEVFAAGSDGHPTGAALASQAFSALASSDPDRQVTFSSPASLTSGTLYCIVFTNTDASPSSNYWSLNHWYYLTAPGKYAAAQMSPWLPDTDWAHAMYAHPSGPWSVRDRYQPILDIEYGSGAHQGQSYGEANKPVAAVGKVNGASEMIRERFTVSGGTRTAIGAALRVLKVSGTTADLVCTIRDSGDALIDTITFPAAIVPTGPAPTGGSSNDDLGQNSDWVEGTFSGNVTLTNGLEYRLRFHSSGGTYYSWAIRALEHSYLYTSSTSFSDGVCEKTTDGAAWSSLGVNSNENDLQFFLKTV